MKVTMISHCCLLVEMGGKKILTDPWMTEPQYWGRLYHRFGLGMTIEELPPLDLVIATHGHDDHLDPPTMERLDKSIPVAIFNKAAGKARGFGFTDVRPMKAGDGFNLDDLEVMARFGKHPGGLVTFVLRDKKENTLFFAGDSVYDERLVDIGREFSDIDVSLLPISGGKTFFGKYRFHMGPEESARLAGEIGAKAVIPTHYHFKLAEDKWTPSFFRRSVDVEGKLEEFLKIAPDLCPRAAAAPLKVGESWESPGK